MPLWHSRHSNSRRVIQLILYSTLSHNVLYTRNLLIPQCADSGIIFLKRSYCIHWYLWCKPYIAFMGHACILIGLFRFTYIIWGLNIVSPKCDLENKLSEPKLFDLGIIFLDWIWSYLIHINTSKKARPTIVITLRTDCLWGPRSEGLWKRRV